ncbi:MAG: hypothetical protein ACR2QF_10210 [Geminicoccaceae bacterium]
MIDDYFLHRNLPDDRARVFQRSRKGRIQRAEPMTRKILYFFCGSTTGAVLVVAFIGLIAAIISLNPKAAAGIAVWILLLLVIRLVEYGQEFAERERQRRA